MCGRYALALRPSQVRAYLEEEDMPVADAPGDDAPDAPRQSYNFAPGYHGIVYRADTPHWGAGPQPGRLSAEDGDRDNTVQVTSSQASDEFPKYKLQSMKWGLVPFWTKRNPDYGSIIRTINCRDDSLAQSGGMWTTMKARKRCIVLSQGFFEWLKVGPKEKVPHFVKRTDGKLMCFAGLWDCVQYDDDSDEKHYTYTIVTTDSNKQLRFLHDRMPVILEPGSEGIKTWLDPSRHEWSRELQSLLKPSETKLEVYPVSKDVGKVGNNSPSFLIPVNSKENKSNIANFFDNAKKKGGSQAADSKFIGAKETSHSQSNSAPEAGVKPDADAIKAPSKRRAEELELEDKHVNVKQQRQTLSNWKAPKGVGGKISATRNEFRSPPKSRIPGNQKITKFFGNIA